MHLWQVVRDQAAAMPIPNLTPMQQHLLALRACQLTENASQAAVRLVLDLIRMMHTDEGGRCGPMIETIGTPRLQDAAHTGVTPSMQMVAVAPSAAPPSAKRGLTQQISLEEGRRRKSARADHGSRNSTAPALPKGGGAP